jgi:DNA-binding IscR family transcriptional regulator
MLKEENIHMPLLSIARITKDVPELNTCLLTFKECNKDQPCALHQQLESVNNEIMNMLSSIAVADLIKKEKKEVNQLLTSLTATSITKNTAA